MKNYRPIRIALGLVLIAATMFATGAFAVEPSVAAERPNILVIMSDDQGIGDIGYNNTLAHTPEIDRLAEQSARFTNFVACPACTPSRASYLTGRNFNYTGVWGVGPRGYINRDETFFAEYLRRAGYRTAHFGKWGEGWTPDQRTYKRGYTDVVAFGGGYQHKDPWCDEQGTLVQRKGWAVDILADLTIDFMRRQTKAKQPWYAITAYMSPHSPWECDPKFSDPLEKEGYSKPLAAFYGMVRQMDIATGRILDEIDRLGIAENTVVIFVSDNGATSHCERTGGTPLESDDWKKRNSLGLRGQKSTVFQNGIRVPCLVRWPGKVPVGLRGQLASYEDILPTVLDLTGVDDSVVPNHLPLHGISLKPILMDPKASEPERYLFRVPVAYEGVPPTWSTMIIEDPKKIRYEQLHLTLRGERFAYHSLPGGKQALYDLAVDPGETTDVAGEHPELTQKLARQCRQEWDALIASDRCFHMPVFLIGDPRYKGMKRCWAHLPPDVVPANAPQSLTGTVVAPFAGAKGFAAKGDSARYSIDVRTPGTYRVSMVGTGLDRCAPLHVTVDKKTLTPEKPKSNTIEYGTVELSQGVMDLVVTAQSPTTPEVKPATIREIAVTPVD